MGAFDGGVHSITRTFMPLAAHGKAARVETVRIHCFQDGGDVSPPRGFMRGKCAEIASLRITTVMGRY
jgi:bisphosphoglycerate-independent phosphoglycerate mutase (AlkP superfamily)